MKISMKILSKPIQFIRKLIASKRHQHPLKVWAKQLFHRPWHLSIVTYLIVVLFGLPAISQSVTAFNALYTVKTTGDIQIIGNTLLTCQAGTNSTTVTSLTCAAAQGTTLTTGARNDGFTMVYVDADTDTSTSNSSTATLTLPANSTVLKAYLFWGGVSSNTSRNTVKFKTPVAGYTALTGAITGSTAGGFGNSTGDRKSVV